MKTDLEIARQTALLPIGEVARLAGIDEAALEPYGRDKAKLDLAQMDALRRKPGKLILVTAINPTPAGEGKTTTTIGLGDALRLLGKNAMLALREPSLGPVFGLKGGATGGGYAQIAPMEDINLHFTGDLHAVGAANNLLAAMVDNHIYQGNELNIDPRRVVWRRCVDMNDRQLRFLAAGEPTACRARTAFPSPWPPRSWRCSASRGTWPTSRNGWRSSSWPTPMTKDRSRLDSCTRRARWLRC